MTPIAGVGRLWEVGVDKPLPIRHKIDAGDPNARVAVALCREPGCGWRHLANSRPGAHSLLASHAETMHRARHAH